MRKKWLISLLLIMSISINVNITYADTASDIPSSWAKAEIDEAIAAELLPVDLQSEYRSNITREEFSAVAVSLFEALSGQKTAVHGENPFTDTENVQVRIANELGIVKGVSPDKFAPNNEITRQEISVMLYRTLKAAKPKYDYTGPENHDFADNAKISSWAKNAVCYLYGIEVINGAGDNRFNPLDNTTREEAYILAGRMHENVLAAKGSLVVTRGGISRGDGSTQLQLAKLIAAEMGKPYQWGGIGPDSYDCSGLTSSIYGKLGITLPRISRDQATVGTYVAKEDLAYGDLVFFARDGQNINHVGIYVGNGEFVHAPQTGDVVKKTTLVFGYYQRSYYTARRVLD